MDGYTNQYLRSHKVLTRDQFREGVFCDCPAKDAHHIIERRLFDDGGYYLDNGASLCEEHHIKAEETTLSCEEIRAAAGITKIVLPDHFYSDNEYTYDKWGNIILANGQRLKGELFFDESVQKILNQGGFLDIFSKYVKYPRTLHLPWSEKLTKDDKMTKSLDNFKGIDIMRTVRSFDPCLPCGVHMYTGNGKVVEARHMPMFGNQK